MDTVEWGTDVDSDEPHVPIWRRWVGPQHARIVAAVGVCALFASASGPWLTADNIAGLGLTSATDALASGSTASVGLSGLDDSAMGFFYAGWVVLLALVGLALFGAVRQRRAAVGLGFGAATGIGFCLLVAFRAVREPLQRFPQNSLVGPHVHPAWGMWVGIVALASMVGALACTQLPQQVRRPAVESTDSAGGLDLVVAEVPSLDGRSHVGPLNGSVRSGGAL